MEDKKAQMLEGVRVIDLTTYLAAPAAGRMLAYMGADVIKVESPTGDPYRHQGEIYGIPTDADDNPLFAEVNDGKRFIVLDLKNKDDLESFYKLIKTADIFITNLRQAALDKLKVDFNTLHEINPKLVYGRISGYGTKGELKDKVGFDSTAYFARGGHMLDYVAPGMPPNNMMLGAGDANTAMPLVAGCLAAYYKVLAGGEGREVDVSLLGTSIWMASMDYVISQYSEDFFIDRTYQCKDGSYMYLQAITDKQKAVLLDIIGMSRAEYDDHFGAIPKLREIYKTKTFDEWVAILDGTGVCIERLRHISELPKDEQAKLNDFLEPYGRGYELWIPSPPIKTDADVKSFQSSVVLGRDTESVLAELSE